MFVAQRENQSQVTVKIVPFNCPEFRGAPPTTRFGKVSLTLMITMLVEHEARNEHLLKLITSIKPSRQVLVLSDRREHCKWLQSHFPDTSGLYMGGMKQKDLEASSKKPIIFATFQQVS